MKYTNDMVEIVGENMNLFQLGHFTLSSGLHSRFKIDCDALTDEDWKCLAYLIAMKVEPFNKIIPVPSGGVKLALSLDKYRITDGTPVGVLIVDDVFTTGKSMEFVRSICSQTPVKGAVVFARHKTPDWITLLFVMEHKNES